MKKQTKRAAWIATAAVVVAASAWTPLACSSGPAPAVARRVESRTELVGGRRALGEVGDFKLSNGIIQVLVQDVGHSRGFGAFGGSLIDIDLVRASKSSAATGVEGNDQFTELFPAFFLEAMEPTKVEIVNAGGKDQPAVVRVTGDGNQFLSLAKGFNQIILGDAKLSYQVDYILEPGKQYVKAEVTVRNDGDGAALFGVDVPTGFITLLGAGQKLFVPGKAGYDMRFRLDEVYADYADKVDLNALPGEIASMVVTEGQHTSYAFASADPKGSPYLSGKANYAGAPKDGMLIPLAYSSFLGTFWGKIPAELGKGKTYTYSAYLAVGSGDVASAQKVIYDAKGATVSRISGRVREAGTGLPLADVAVVLQDDKGNYVSSARTRDDGVYLAWVPAGKYQATAVGEARRPVKAEALVEVGEDASANLDLELERTASLSVKVVDQDGLPIPAKVSVEGIHEPAESRGAPWTFLYDLRVGEGKKPTDFLRDTDDDGTRRYLETHFFVNHGRGGSVLRPGKYTVHVSRGIEYDLASVPVELAPGEEEQVSVVLNHVMKTPDYLSGDFHVHSEHSVDSSIPLDLRVLTYAAEGVDYIASTDHNYISDFQPVVDGLRLTDHLATSVGLELTTLEMGHFNAWPLKYDEGPVTHGAFNWFRVPPAELFGRIRTLARHGPENVLVQVNHPRDTIMGYFNQFNVDAYGTRAMPPNSSFSLDQEPQKDEEKSPYHYTQFSHDFDVIEVFNGKRQDLLHHYRIPAVPPEGPEPQAGVVIPPPGEILEKRVRTPEGIDTDCSEEPLASTKCIWNPVYPGVLDEYYTFLGHGRRVTGVGNSDSHDDEDEAGLPRTYLRVGESANGSMKSFDELAAVEALKNQRVIVTNGPFVELFVNDQPVGSRVLAPDGKVSVRIKVQAAPWVDVDRVVLVRGGKDRQKTVEVVREWSDVAPTQEVLRFEETITVEDVPDQSFFAVEVSGDRSMWPVYTPYEIPSLAVNEAVGAIASSFGFGDTYGKYKPQQTQLVRPFAFTNPVFVDRTLKQELRAPKKALPLEPVDVKSTRHIPDLRKLLQAFHED